MQHTWVFQLAKEIAGQEADRLMQRMDAFLSQWKAHGTPVPGTAEIQFQRFLVVQALPGSTSGCSIDAMTREVHQILGEMGVEIWGPETVFFLEENGQLGWVDFRNLESICQSGQLHAESIVFDSSLGQQGDIRLWKVPLKSTWMNRFLPSIKA